MERRSKSLSEEEEASNSIEEGKTRRRRRSKQMYRGVRMRRWGRWVSEIRMPNNKGRIWLGSYDSAYKAALAYDLAAFCLRGRSAMLNFPEFPPSATALPPKPYSPRRIQTAASLFAFRSHAADAAGAKPVAHSLAPARVSGMCFRSKSNDSSSTSTGIMSSGYYCTDVEDVASSCLPALDNAVLDSLASFLEAHSHTEWWLG